MAKKQRFFSAKNIAYLSVLTALVVVLQLFGSNIKILSTSLSFVLVPIVLGGLLLGPWAGAFLGFIFGLITYLSGVTGADAFTNILFVNHPFLTALTCFGKGIAAGLGSGYLFLALKNKNIFLAVFLASAAAPILNTGLFIVGALCMGDTITANFVESGSTIFYFLFIVCAGVNFLVEFAINLLLAPAIYRVERVVNRQFVKPVAVAEEQPQSEEIESSEE